MGNYCKGTECQLEDYFEIKSKMILINIPKLDEYFTQGECILKQAEEIRSGLQDAPRQMMIISNGYILKEPTVQDAIQVWLYAISASFQGNLSRSKIRFYQHQPFLECDIQNCSDDCKQFKEHLKKYIETCYEAPVKIKYCMSEGKKLIENIMSVYLNDLLNVYDADMRANYTDNVRNLKVGLAKISSLEKFVYQEYKQMDDIFTFIASWLSDSKEKGIQANQQHLIEPSQCIVLLQKPLKSQSEFIKIQTRLKKQKQILHIAN